MLKQQRTGKRGEAAEAQAHKAQVSKSSRHDHGDDAEARGKSRVKAIINAATIPTDLSIPTFLDRRVAQKHMAEKRAAVKTVLHAPNAAPVVNVKQEHVPESRKRYPLTEHDLKVIAQLKDAEKSKDNSAKAERLANLRKENNAKRVAAADEKAKAMEGMVPLAQVLAGLDFPLTAKDARVILRKDGARAPAWGWAWPSKDVPNIRKLLKKAAPTAA